MSLINEALKKAQRQRTDPAPGLGEASAAGGSVQKRATPMRAQTMIVFAAAGFALVVCSVVATVYLVNRPPAEPSRTTAAPTPRVPVADSATPAPVIIAPVVAPPTAAAPAKPATVLADTGPVASDQSGAQAGPVSTTAAEPAAIPRLAATAAPTSAAAAPVTPTAPPDPRVQQFVDAIKVAGIRSSGTESKVLMNDRVFRVNEIVERTLAVKLVKVESDALTFVDAHGVTYTKSF